VSQVAMNHPRLVHAPLGGRYWNRFTAVLVALAGLAAVLLVWRFAFGLSSVTNMHDGYPWGIWIAIDVVVATALGCGGYAVAILAYVLNRGHYHPLVRPAVLTSLLGYGMGAVGVVVDLGRPWELWKVPLYFWRWTGSPQLEVALCITAYMLVLLIEASPALLERVEKEAHGRLQRFSKKALRGIEKALPFILALGLLLPSMHQSSLGTMILLTGAKLHALWFTSWVPFLFLVSALVMGYGVVVAEASFSAWAFGRPRETEMLARLSKVALGVAAFWVAFRVGEVALAGELPLVASRKGIFFVLEVALHLAGVAILLSPGRRANGIWQARAGLLLVFGGAVYRINTYLVAYQPGDQYSYFPAVPEMLITIGVFAAEIALYIWAVRRFPILAGHAAAGH
jgi:Ni/Fe-hydrogenase subunit HybB-like protein